MAGTKETNPANLFPEVMKYYDVLGVHPHDIPAVGVFDEPTVQTCINAQWLSHLVSGFERFIYRDAWRGTDAEIDSAINSVLKVIAEFDKAENMNCCCGSNKLTRINQNGSIEVSTDGGVTWNTATGLDDPRNSIPLLPPASGAPGPGLRCELASSATALIQEAQKQTSGQLGLGSGISDLTIAILAILMFFEVVSLGTLTPLVLTLVAALIGMSSAAFDAAFNVQVWLIVQCAIYCNTPDDGSDYTQAQLDAIRADISSLTGIAYTFVDTQLRTWGPRLLTNASRSGFSTNFDCSACQCDCAANWSLDTGSELPTPYYPGYVSYQSAFDTNRNYIRMRTTSPNDCCEVLDVKFDLVGQTGNNFTPFGILKWDCGVDWAAANSAGALTGSCISKITTYTHNTINPNDVFVMSILFAECP